MKRGITVSIAAVALAVVVGGCQSDPATSAETTTHIFPQLIQREGRQYLILKSTDVPGMTYELVKEIELPGIITRPRAALVVPQQALVFDGDAYYAFVQVASDRVARQQVQIGAWNERGYARVLAGLTQDDLVIVKKSNQLNALWHEALGESS